MRAGEAFRTGWREIRTNAARSVLSFAAVSVGVGSVLYTFAQTRGLHEASAKAIELMGPGRMSVEPKRDYVSKGISPGLTVGDADALRRALPGLHMIYPKVWQGAVLRYGDRRVEDFTVQGITPDWRLRDWVYTLRGRFLSERDVRDGARVCVVIEPGGWIRKPFWATWWRERPVEEFIKRHDLLGRRILLNDRVFTVVGVLKEPPRDKDPRWFHWERVNVLLPVTTMHRYLRNDGGRQGVDTIELDTGAEASVRGAKAKVEALLRRRHNGEEDFEVNDNREMIQNQLNETKGYVLIGTVLGAVALLAGGIGIMNVTLATIFSRVKEIGIRRAVGASRADILGQFLVEAMLLGLSGGVAGLGLGLAGVSYLSRQSVQHDLATVTWTHMAAAVAIAIAVSCLFALYPAWSAARLDPVAALRD